MKKAVNAFDYAGDILKRLPKGVLLTTKAGDKVNTMTIGWGHIGIEWGKPVFVAYVRDTRYTREMLAESGEFTINVPNDDTDSRILTVCGRNSGRDMNKVQELDLTAVKSDHVASPGFKELPLTLECRVLYKSRQDGLELPADIQKRYYPECKTDDPQCHVAYYGEIVGAYLITD